MYDDYSFGIGGPGPLDPKKQKPQGVGSFSSGSWNVGMTPWKGQKNAPSAVVQRQQSILKAGGQCVVYNDIDGGYTIHQGAPQSAFMKQHNISGIFIKYDSEGHLKSQTQVYTKGNKKSETFVYENGKKKEVIQNYNNGKVMKGTYGPDNQPHNFRDVTPKPKPQPKSNWQKFKDYAVKAYDKVAGTVSDAYDAVSDYAKYTYEEAADIYKSAKAFDKEGGFSLENCIAHPYDTASAAILKLCKSAGVDPNNLVGKTATEVLAILIEAGADVLAIPLSLTSCSDGNGLVDVEWEDNMKLDLKVQAKEKEIPVRETVVEVIKEVPVEVIVEKIVEKIVEVEVPVEVEKIVEVIVEKIVEVPVEVLVEVIKEIYVEVPVEVIVEIIKEVEKIVYVEVPVEVPGETIYVDPNYNPDPEPILDDIKDILEPGNDNNGVTTIIQGNKLFEQHSLDARLDTRNSSQGTMSYDLKVVDYEDDENPTVHNRRMTIRRGNNGQDPTSVTAQIYSDDGNNVEKSVTFKPDKANNRVNVTRITYNNGKKETTTGYLYRENGKVYEVTFLEEGQQWKQEIKGLDFQDAQTVLSDLYEDLKKPENK